MKSEWKMCLLGDALTFQRGKDLPKNEMSGQGYPVVGSNGIIGYHNKYNVEAPCLTVGRSGNVGLPYLIHGRAWAHNTTLYVKEFKLIDPIFAYYLIKAMQLGFYAGGSAVPTLNRNHIHLLEICIPSLPTQRKIASILSSLDDKIENNNAICKNLEEQAAALYKSWFVDFEPYKGRRPEEWKVVKLSEVAAKISDGVHNTIVDVADSYYYLLSCKNIVGGQLKITDNERRIGKRDFMRLRKRTQLSRGDILLSSVGTVGELVLLREEPENFEFQRSVAIIKANSDLVSPDYLFWTLRNMQAAICAAAHGAVQQCLFLGDIANFDILLPTKEAVNKFNLLIAGQGNKIALLEDENKRLASLRDTLLPKLMSGELEVDKVAI